MTSPSHHVYSERGSITAIEAAITMSIGLFFAVGAYLFQQHSAEVTSHDRCVIQKMAEVDNKGQLKYNMADPTLLSKLKLDCVEGGQ